MFDISAQQRQASDPKANVYVSASAGTGKTKVLCDRVIRLMLAGSNISNILCLTFTNAASAEMKERVASKLKNWLKLSDYDLATELKNLEGIEVGNDVLDKARKLYGNYLDHYSDLKIQTIHSLCSQIINNFPEIVGSAQIIDQAKKQTLINAAIDFVLDVKDEHIVSAKNKLSEFYDYGQLIAFFNQVLAKKITFRNAIRNEIDAYSLYGANRDLSVTNLEVGFINAVPKNLVDAAKLLAQNGIKLGHEIIDSLNPVEFHRYKNCFFTQAGAPRKNLLNKKQADQFAEINEVLYSEVERLIEYEKIKNAQMSAQMHEAFFIFMKHAFEQYEIFKKRERVLEYDDQLLEAINLLKGISSDHILLKLDYVIDHILVDEAQDLSELQWEIIKTLSEEFFSGQSSRLINRTIFIVGDYKQSIYSFQGANPDVFLDIKKYFAERATNVNKLWREVAITTSFRSTQPVLELVDKVFNLPDYRGGLGGDEVIKHHSFRNGGGVISILQLAAKKVREKVDGWRIPSIENESYDPKSVIAKTVAENIASWVLNKRKLLGHDRIVEPKDILILVRKRGAVLHHITNELKNLGIQVSEPDTLKLKDNILVQDIMSLIKFILLPIDDLNLACLLKSPFFNLSEEELFVLCHNRESSIWDALKIKHEKTRIILDEFIDLSSKLDFMNFCLEIIARSKGDFKKRFGSKAIRMLNSFLDFAKSYADQGTPSLEGFVDYFEKGDVEVKSTVIQSENKVRIMTVHAAKGLQAPIVILADTASTENSPHTNIFCHDGQIYFSSYKEFDTPFLDTMKQIHKQKDSEESLRLLYVAMTRAEDELYVAGWESRNQASSWYSILESNITEQDLSQSFTYALQDKIVGDRKTLPSFLAKPFENIAEFKKNVIATEKASNQSAEIMRGKKIHDLLMIVSKLPIQARDSYLSLIEDQQNAQTVKGVINKFPDIFAKDTLSEFPVIGELNGQKISIRIDKLVVESDRVRIIDFKTHNVGFTNIESYRKQLYFYRDVVKKIWSDKEVLSYILWVDDEIIEQVV